MNPLKKIRRVVADVKHHDFRRLNRRAKRALNQIRKLTERAPAI